MLEITDKTGRRVRITRERWTHICQHPEVVPYLQVLLYTLRDPLRIEEHPVDSSVK